MQESKDSSIYQFCSYREDFPRKLLEHCSGPLESNNSAQLADGFPSKRVTVLLSTFPLCSCSRTKLLLLFSVPLQEKKVSPKPHLRSLLGRKNTGGGLLRHVEWQLPTELAQGLYRAP